MSSFFDSHCHLTDERLRDRVPEVLAAAQAAGVARVVTIASDLEDARAALALARSHDGLYCTGGVHPHQAELASDQALAAVRELADDPLVVAIGEAGLDFHYDNAPRDRQHAAFEAQLAMAAELDLPIVVHSRDADEAMIAALREWGGRTRGVLHCFAGGRALLDAGLAAGWHVSFSGLVSFRNYDGAELVRAVPDERLLIETDSPYLAPVPRRGRTNEPAYVVHVAEAVATLRGQSVEQVAALTDANARAFYRIDG